MAGMIYQGIETASIESELRMRGIEDMRACRDQIRHLESGALDILNEK